MINPSFPSPPWVVLLAFAWESITKAERKVPLPSAGCITIIVRRNALELLLLETRSVFAGSLSDFRLFARGFDLRRRR
ncbi:hypothetical protein ZHAS_00001438 [Anopheles sinensis]|uniref:Secreted protein n=1 Tax=Anopheles sinensis TaxID=74873 RepID=A0A084VBC0_ANOSI|nr:hypothetical protein ZHAS_00001438 [Anopheles sinensis]